MKWILFLLLSVGVAVAQTTVSPLITPVATVAPLHQWDAAKVPWDDWFKKKATVENKTDGKIEYIYFFWDAQVFRANFGGKDKKKRLAEAALQLVSRLTPADAKLDLIKIDIAYITEEDSYGENKWDSIQQVAHLEISKAKALAAVSKKTALSDGVLKKLFAKFQVF